MHLVCSDEFYVYVKRRPNFQNDRVWGRSVEEIEDQERIVEMTARPDCIGIFLCFSAREMLFVIKESGESWDGNYFREVILSENVIPFLKDENKVIDPAQVTFLHDRAPCMKALATQELLRENDIDFFGNQEWPGNSPDLNACEHLGAIMKEKVEQKMIRKFPHNNFTKADLHEGLLEVLEAMKNDTELFENLLRSYPSRLEAVKIANGGHTDY